MSKLRPVETELAASCDGGLPTGSMATTAAQAWCRSGARNAYALFQEMEDSDAHLFSVLQTRKNALLACGWKVMPGNDSAAAKGAAQTVEDVLRATDDLHTSLYHLLDALGKGFAIAEVLWRVDSTSGRVGIDAIRARYQGDFAFDREGNTWLLENPWRLAGAAGHQREISSDSPALAQFLPRPGEAMVWHSGARKMPPRKFLHFAFQGNTCCPYGAALCAKLYRYYYYKKNNLRYWACFNEKFGQPTAVARYTSLTSDDEKAALEGIVGDLQSNPGVLIPDGTTLEYLEAKGGASVSSYRDLSDWCNDEMSKAVLGQTLSSGEGRRSGSLALAEVHERVRRDYLASDARALGEVLGNQLSRWITDFNHGPHVPAPRVVFDCSDHADQQRELQIDRELVKMGVGLPTSYFHEKYGRPSPVAGDRTLRYDDSNLYQYHLLFGVLTINEVRATLGLPPVPWGDTPPRQAEDVRGGGQRGPRVAPASRNLSGGDEEEADLADAENAATEGLRDRRAR